jgi:hypothetical protein
MITGIWKKIVFAVIFGLIIASQAYAQQSLQVTPTAINYGNVTIGNTDSRTVTVTNNNSEGSFTFRVDIAEGSDPAFSITRQPTTTTLEGGQSTTFDVGFSPIDTEPANGTVLVSASNEDVAAVTLTGQGVPGGTPPPTLQVQPTTVDFGSVVVGNTEVRTVTVTNNDPEGTLTFTVTLTSGSEFGFFISSQPQTTTLGPRQSTTFGVGFKPASDGLFRGSVLVNSNFGSATVSLVGQGREGARILVVPTDINFGTVSVGNTVTRTVTVSNAGREPLTFSGRIAIGTDPGFFIASQPGTSTLRPGQSTNFTVGFRPSAGSPDDAFGTIVINSNGGDATIRLRARVAPQGVLQVNPTAINFGIVNIGETTTRTVTVTNAGSGPLTFSASLINGANAGFGISQPATLALGPGESTTFEVRFTPNSSNSAGGAIQINSDFGNFIIRLSGQGNVTEVPPAGTLEVQPTNIDFGNVSLGSSATRTVTIRNAGPATINLSQVTLSAGSEAGFFIASQPAATTLGPGQSTTIEVGFRPVSAGSDQSSGTVTINSTGGNATVGLRGRGNIQAAPVLEMNTAVLDFGQVLTGESRTLTFTVRNAAGLDAAALEIGSVNVQTVEGLNTFQVTGIPEGPIPPGGSRQISITFAPLEIDPVTGSVGQITITSNAGQPVTLTARGRGIVRLSFSGGRVIRVKEGLSANVTLSLQGRPPANGLTIPLEASFENGALDLVLEQNLADVLQVEEQLSQTITFTQANEQRTITITTRDIEIGPRARLTLRPAGGINPALQLDPITVVLKPDNSPDLLRTFNCDGCQAGFTQDGDTLRVIVAYFDQNADVERLTLLATNDRGETMVIPTFTRDSVPALPSGSRGFALRVRLIGFSSFGTVRSIDVFVEDAAGNNSSARLPDGPRARTQLLVNRQPNQSGDGDRPKVISIEVLPQP